MTEMQDARGSESDSGGLNKAYYEKLSVDLQSKIDELMEENEMMEAETLRSSRALDVERKRVLQLQAALNRAEERAEKAAAVVVEAPAGDPSSTAVTTCHTGAGASDINDTDVDDTSMPSNAHMALIDDNEQLRSDNSLLKKTVTRLQKQLEQSLNAPKDANVTGKTAAEVLMEKKVAVKVELIQTKCDMKVGWYTGVQPLHRNSCYVTVVVLIRSIFRWLN